MFTWNPAILHIYQLHLFWRKKQLFFSGLKVKQMKWLFRAIFADKSVVRDNVLLFFFFFFFFCVHVFCVYYYATSIFFVVQVYLLNKLYICTKCSCTHITIFMWKPPWRIKFISTGSGTRDFLSLSLSLQGNIIHKVIGHFNQLYTSS